jgi:hypothetical protein
MAILIPDTSWHANDANVVQHISHSDSGGRKARWLCASCGTWIFGGAPRGAGQPGSVRFIRAGTLDDTSWLRPTVHFWTRSAQPWITLTSEDVTFETQPSDLMAWVRQNS